MYQNLISNNVFFKNHNTNHQKKKGKESLRPSINHFLAHFRRIVILQALTTVLKRRPGEKLFMYGANHGSPVIKRAPKIRIGNLVVEGGLERREGAINGIEDDLLTKLGEDAFFSNDELQSILLAYIVPGIDEIYGSLLFLFRKGVYVARRLQTLVPITTPSASIIFVSTSRFIMFIIPIRNPTHPASA